MSTAIIIFECLEAVDTALFNDQMNRLLAGEEVVLPTFNFKTGHKGIRRGADQAGAGGRACHRGDPLPEPKDDACPAGRKQVPDLHQRPDAAQHRRAQPDPTTDGRLIRRLVRDARTRGASARRTIAMWPSVRQGEEENIFPYQEEADVMFNSALIYELAVLKQYVEPLLFGIERDCREYLEAKRLLKFLDYFVGIESSLVPANSLLREFIGGGCFRI